MKIVAFAGFIVISLFFPSFAYAQTASPTPTPQPAPVIQWTNEFTVQNEPSSVISLLKNFIEGFDSFLGGFIFYTPDPLASTIKLKDDSEIPGVGKYRDIFYQIAIPILAIIIAGIAMAKIGMDNTHELKAFAIRFLIVIALFLTVPLVLSYSIQFNNLLVAKISDTQKFTVFLDDYFDKSQEKITAGESSESFGIPSFDLSLKSGIFKSLGTFIVQIFLFALTFLFLLCGFVYLGFLFIIRFATLLFLGIIYPVILPFALSERTQPIVYSFFKTWFTFLIQQPAFVLGFAIATDIFSAILNAKGPSVGMLFFYTGFLFFLGGVNMLVARIFGDVWTAASTNMVAAISARTVTQPISSTFGDFKKGLLGGSVSSLVGRQVRGFASGTKKKEEDTSSGGTGSNQPSSIPNSYVSSNNNQSGGSKYAHPTKEGLSVPVFSQKLANKGLRVEPINQKQGVVSVTGEAFKYQDNKTGMTSYYPTRTEAIQDGVPDKKLEKVNLQDAQFIDLSSFGKFNPNPHNFNAMQESKKKGKELNYAFINKSSPPQKVRNFLDMAKERNSAYGIQGVIVERQAAKGSDPVIRMYSQDNKGGKS
ncbi:MAG: hypothetical protein HYV37_03300 [Candidatus Levyibacteriota bacterium]|nr:MAG: hypothetical protein HYV37_03300 [Candidatus Levybacteria bacterium]